jgi:hypothetical protein
MLGNCFYCSTNFQYKPAAQAGKYCSNLCQQAFQKQQRITAWLDGGKKPGKSALKDYFTATHGYKCSCCGISEWNSLSIVLEIDHKNGNPYDDSPKNLRLLCPNCHSQTSTYKAKNKGHGRVHRREKARLNYKNKPL